MARETINGISVPVPSTGEPPDFVADLRRIAQDAGTAFDLTPDIYFDAALMGDGPIQLGEGGLNPDVAAGFVRGEFVGSYGNSPAFVADGKITHTPSPASNAAAYIELRADNGETIVAAELDCDFGASTDCTFANVVPNQTWESGIANAGVHLTANAAGPVSNGRNVGGANEGTVTARVPPLSGVHTLRFEVDELNERIRTLLDGIELIDTADATALTMLSDRWIAELFQGNGNTGTPGHILRGRAWTRRAVPPPLRGVRVEPTRKHYSKAFNAGSVRSFPASSTYRSALREVASGTTPDPSGAPLGSLAFYYPPSGRMHAQFRAWLETNTLSSGAVMGSLGSAADQRLAKAGVTGEIVLDIILTGTPGALQVIQPQVWYSDPAATGAAVVAYGGGFGDASLSAWPAEPLVEFAPAISVQPSSTSVAAGATATFKSSPLAEPTASTQWQKSTDAGATWADIGGANSTTYTTPATSSGDNGSRYRAVFTNTKGAITSNAATLTVT